MTELPTSTLASRLQGARFAIVSAPAGFGKTSVIRDSVVSTDRTVVWAVLGTAFRTDASSVVAGLVEAARAFGAAVRVDYAVENPACIGSSTSAALADLLAAVDGPCTLVIDDLHLAPSSLQRELAVILHRWFADDRHLIVSSRDRLSTLSEHWPIHEASLIQPGDLVLSGDAVAHVLGPDLRSFSDRVEQLTGGWANGVDVLRRCLHDDPVGGFPRAELMLASQISSEVLAQFSDDDLELLMLFSLSGAVPPTVVERASSRAGSAGRLRGLVHETAFVIADGERLDLVPVFRQALVKRMFTTEPGAVAPTHMRLAEAWLDEPTTAQSTEQALHHLHEAGEFERAVEVLHQRWGVLYTESRLDVLVDLMERIPVRYWADDPGSALLLGWSHLLIGRSTRALDLIQSPCLRTPVGAAIKRLVWAQGVWWTTGPAEALQLIAEGRARLAGLPPDATFPDMPGNDDVPAFLIVADGAEVRARFLIGDLLGAVELLDALVAQPSQLEPISVAGLHAVGALIRAVRGDRHEALVHLDIADSLVRRIGVSDHYVMFPADLARALLAALDGDRPSVSEPLMRAVRAADACGAANFQKVCQLVADRAGVVFDPPNVELTQHAARLPLVESSLTASAARRRADLGDPGGAASMLKGVAPTELTLSAWVHVLLLRHPLSEVRRWLSTQPAPECATGHVIRLLCEASVAEAATVATDRVRRAVAIASDRRLLGVVCDAPSALWERPEITRLDVPMLVDARRLLRDGHGDADELRFTTREIELLRLLARSATAAEIADRLYLSVNTVKWHKANIYRKLGVSGSRLAVERAAELGLLGASDLP